MSFTKDIRGENKAVPQDHIRRVAQCADWYTSVGAHGITKSIQYNIARGSTDVVEDVRKLWDVRFMHYLPRVREIADVQAVRIFTAAHEEMFTILATPQLARMVSALK
jgi:hypothetical protein